MTNQPRFNISFATVRNAPHVKYFHRTLREISITCDLSDDRKQTLANIHVHDGIDFPVPAAGLYVTITRVE